MIRLDAKKTSLLLAIIMLAKLASAQGLPWLDDPPPQASLVQNVSANQTRLNKLWRRRLQPQPILPR